MVEKENQIHGSALAVNLRGVSTFIQECSRLFLCPSTENKIRQSKSAILAGMLRCLCKIAESSSRQERSGSGECDFLNCWGKGKGETGKGKGVGVRI